METEELMDEIDLILQTSKAGTMSTSVNDTVNEYMTFYIKDYVLYIETEKNSPIMKGIEHNPFVHITLGGDDQSDHFLEITGETEVVNDLSVINWLAHQKGPLTVETDMVMLKISAQKVKLVEERYFVLLPFYN